MRDRGRVADRGRHPHALYRFFDHDELLYVGITLDPGRRWRAHRTDKTWWQDITRIEVETYVDRPSVLAAERIAIKFEHPRYNIVFNTAVPEQDVSLPSEARGGVQDVVRYSCATCDEDVADREGYLFARYPDIAESEVGRHHVVRWAVHHDRCREARLLDYVIPVEQLRHHVDRDDWDKHLHQKTWLWATDWTLWLAQVQP